MRIGPPLLRLLALGLVSVSARAELPRAADGSSPDRASSPRWLVTSVVARSTIDAALRAAGFPAARRRADAMESRLTLSALLPDLSLRVARSTDQSLRFTPTLDDPTRYSGSGGVGWWVDGRATWHLGRLLYDRDELAIERLRSDRAGAAGRLAKRVLELLFVWQRASLDAADDASSEEERAAALLRATETEVTLDVLTDGWFSRRR